MEGLTIAEWLIKAVEMEAGKQEGNLVSRRANSASPSLATASSSPIR